MRDPYANAAREQNVDPDLDHTDDTLNVPDHPRLHRITLHRFITVTLIGLGGGCGTLVRWGLESAYPAQATSLPWTTMGINVLGAGLLGALLSWLAHSGPDQGWRRRVRLTLGTGLLGGFTTYSAFSVETVTLIRTGTPWLGLAYVLFSLVAGVFAAGLGDLIVTTMVRHRTREQLVEAR